MTSGYICLVIRIITILLLILHINSSMLLPQLPNQDLILSHGQPADDINSLFEFIDQVVLGNIDHHPEDEDDDRGQQFTQTAVFCNNSTPPTLAVPHLVLFVQTKWPPAVYAPLVTGDIKYFSPPPEC